MRKAFVSEILARVAPTIGATVELEPDYGFVGSVRFKSGKTVLFKDRNFNVNPQGSSEIARDKGYTSYFLRKFGYSVPEDITVFGSEFNEHLEKQRTIDDGFAFAQSIDFPVMLKPYNLSQGALISKVYNKREFYTAAKRILKRSSIMVVQQYVAGSDFRIVVLDDEVISAYERRPLEVVGDGTSSVLQLLEAKQLAFVETGRDTVINFEDVRMVQKLRKDRMTLESIPELGRVVKLLDIANLSTGGDAVDVTDLIHPDYVQLSVSIAKDFGLRLCGVDLLTEGSISEPIGSYVIIEINSASGLDNYASMGTDQVSRVDELYRKVLLSLEA